MPLFIPKLPPTSPVIDRKSTRLNSSHVRISYAVFCLKKKTISAMAGPPSFGRAGQEPRRQRGELSGRERLRAVAERGAVVIVGFFFFNDPATTEIYTLSLHDALPI